MPNNYPCFRRRQYGPRCSSPPTFVCYELPQSDSYSRSSSPTSSDHYSGEDDDGRDSESDTESHSDDEDNSSSNGSSHNIVVVERMTGDEDLNVNLAVESVDVGVSAPTAEPQAGMDVDPKDIPCPSSGNESDDEVAAEKRRAEKREGKKKEVVDGATVDGEAAKDEDKQDEAPTKPKQKKRRSKRRPAPEIRPILTIRSSQGFVWNQDLFVPPYIKERYIASSPPSSIPLRKGSSSPPSKSSGLVNNNFFSTSNAADFEVECVEIRIDEDEMDGLIPRL